MLKPHNLFLTALALSMGSTVANVTISEFLASNTNGLATEQGAQVDWIELSNAGASSLNLAGYTLTDDPDNPAKWALPAVEMAAGTQVVVFASGSDLSDPAGEWHSNFSLAREGGYLGLYSADGVVVSEFVSYPSQREDISYGIANGEAVYFDPPTPGEANATSGFVSFVADTKFSVDRGYYDAPIQVEISSETEDVRILFTTDGRVPSKGSVFTGPIGEVYDGPITIDKTTTLRAVAMKDGSRPSNVDTQTYLFLSDVIRQTGDHLPPKWNGEPADYEMDPRIVDSPEYRDTILEDFKTLSALSITMDPDDFFSTDKGIYPGKLAREGLDKACSAELLHPGGGEGFQIDCAVRIVGGSSTGRWKTKKLSMRLRFDGKFGPATLNYSLYDEPTAASEFNTLTVDARLNNSWAYDGGSEPPAQRNRAQYSRDQFAADLQRELGGFTPHGRHVHTFINGVYWGMYNLHERPDDAFNASYQGGEPEEWNVIRHGGVAVNGANSLSDYRDLLSLSRDADTSEGYDTVGENLDIDGLIDYMLVNFVLGNTDWAHQNFYASRLTTPGGKWRFHSWDAELTMKNLNENVVTKNDPNGPTGLHQRLRASADYKIRFADLVHKHMKTPGGVLTTEGLRRIYHRRTEEIDRAVILESARWGDAAVSQPYTRNEHWISQRDYLMNDYFVERINVVLDQLSEEELMGDIQAPTFAQHGGSVASGEEVEIKKSVFAPGDVYYTLDGSDPRKPSGELSESAQKLGEPIILTETTTVKARVHKSSVFGAKDWSALLEATFVVDAVPASDSNLVVTKINYRPAAASDEEAVAGYSRKDFEFVELMNVSEERIDLREAVFVRGISFDFAAADIQTIEPGGAIFLVKNLAAFEMRYGSSHQVAGEYAGSLSNDGERLEVQAGGASILDFSYNDAGDWPLGTDGDGSYLVLVEPMTSPDSGKAGSWRASGPNDSPQPVTGSDPGGEGQLTYAMWSTANFGADSASALANLDPDGDGVVNYLEYLMGGDPNDNLSAPRIAVSWSDDGFGEFEVPLRKDTDEGELVLETSRTLDTWQTVSDAALEVLGMTDQGDVEVTRYKVLQLTKDATWTERFVRAKVVLPAN